MALKKAVSRPHQNQVRRNGRRWVQLRHRLVKLGLHDPTRYRPCKNRREWIRPFGGNTSRRVSLGFRYDKMTGDLSFRQKPSSMVRCVTKPRVFKLQYWSTREIGVCEYQLFLTPIYPLSCRIVQPFNPTSQLRQSILQFKPILRRIESSSVVATLDGSYMKRNSIRYVKRNQRKRIDVVCEDCV